MVFTQSGKKLNKLEKKLKTKKKQNFSLKYENTNMILKNHMNKKFY